jgi:class 3 adenylate cyclase
MTKEQILALHPWPEAYAGAGERRLDWLWVFDLPGKPDALWRLISDTSRLNRALGVAEMTFTARGTELWGTAKNGGVQHEWHEVPWNWVAGQWLTCTRVYTRGFAKVMYAIHRIEPREQGCRVYLYFGAVPRGALGRLALRYGFPSVGRAYHRVLPEVAEQLARMQPMILQLAAPELRPEATQRLAAVREQLRGEGLEVRCVDALFDWIRSGDEADLYRIQVRERARAWDVDERDLLRVALHATRAGVLSLSWDTICPHCRGVTEENPALGTMRPEVRCEVCAISFDTSSESSVEVTFHVHSSIREVAQRHYCSAEPATKDHIRVQLEVPAGEKVTVTPPLEPGRYRMRKHGEQRYGYLDISESATAEVVTWSSAEGAVTRGAPGVAVEIVNDEAERRMFIVEKSQWTDYALRPGHLLSLQDFRDLFSEDYVAADVQLAVGEQTLLFTDVVGSTAFYVERGDPGAFVEIKRHFDEVFAIVATHRGVAIKTIGDAVMAAFVNPADAVRASHAIHNAFSPSRTDTPIRLRISLNTGPCIAVRFNANIDYFGGTVNVAAKLQSLAEAWQVAMSEATYQAPGVIEYLREQQAETVALSYSSKALLEPVAARQWTVFRAASQATLAAAEAAESEALAEAVSERAAPSSRAADARAVAD